MVFMYKRLGEDHDSGIDNFSPENCSELIKLKGSTDAFNVLFSYFYSKYHLRA